MLKRLKSESMSPRKGNISKLTTNIFINYMVEDYGNYHGGGFHVKDVQKHRCSPEYRFSSKYLSTGTFINEKKISFRASKGNKKQRLNFEVKNAKKEKDGIEESSKELARKRFCKSAKYSSQTWTYSSQAYFNAPSGHKNMSENTSMPSVNPACQTKLTPVDIALKITSVPTIYSVLYDVMCSYANDNQNFQTSEEEFDIFLQVLEKRCSSL